MKTKKLLVSLFFASFAVAIQAAPIPAESCSTAVERCAPPPKPSGCAAGEYWSLVGTNIAHCVSNDPTCPPGKFLTHDALGNPSCILNPVTPPVTPPVTTTCVPGGPNAPTCKRIPVAVCAAFGPYMDSMWLSVYRLVDPVEIDWKHNGGGGSDALNVPGVDYSQGSASHWDSQFIPGRLYCESYGNGGS